MELCNFMLEQHKIEEEQLIQKKVIIWRSIEDSMVTGKIVQNHLFARLVTLYTPLIAFNQQDKKSITNN